MYPDSFNICSFFFNFTALIPGNVTEKKRTHKDNIMEPDHYRGAKKGSGSLPYLQLYFNFTALIPGNVTEKKRTQQRQHHGTGSISWREKKDPDPSQYLQPYLNFTALITGNVTEKKTYTQRQYHGTGSVSWRKKRIRIPANICSSGRNLLKLSNFTALIPGNVITILLKKRETYSIKLSNNKV